MTFKNYLQSKGYSTESVGIHYRNLTAFINWTEQENIETELSSYNELLSYVRYLQSRENKQRTIQLQITSLRHYFKWLIDLEIRDDNPTKNIEIKGVQRRQLYHILNKQELASLYHHFKLPSEDKLMWYNASKRNKIIVGLMIWQGLTTKELGKLTVQDVKLREGKIYIAGSRRSNERELKLESHQILDMMEYILQTRKELMSTDLTENLFVTDRMSNIMIKLLPKLKKQSSKVSSIQQIRTSVITHWLRNYNLREVQYMAGHRYVSSTEAYLINDLDDLTEEITKYHPIT